MLDTILKKYAENFRRVVIDPSTNQSTDCYRCWSWKQYKLAANSTKLERLEEGLEV